MSTGHAKLSPSKAHTWLNCPGSVRLSEGLPDEPSDASRQGTACHEAFRLMLEGRFVPGTYNVDEHKVLLTAEMRAWVHQAAEWVQRYKKAHPGASMRCEERVPVGKRLELGPTGAEALWGTADVVLRDDTEIVVVDAKFGFNEVEAEENPQLGLYAVGAGALENYERIGLVILQPRSAEPVKEEWLTPDQLQARAGEYAHGALLALDGTGPLHASPKACAWCPAHGVCPEAQREALALARQEFSIVPEKLAPSEIGLLLSKAKAIRAALAAVEEFAAKELEVGRYIPGWKRVLPNTHRKWKDDAADGIKAMLPLLTDAPAKLYDEPKLKSPNQLERELHLSPGTLNAFTLKPEGTPVVVPESDPRPAVKPEFGTVETKEEED